VHEYRGESGASPLRRLSGHRLNDAASRFGLRRQRSARALQEDESRSTCRSYATGAGKGRSTAGESPADPRRPTGRYWIHRRDWGISGGAACTPWSRSASSRRSCDRQAGVRSPPPRFSGENRYDSPRDWRDPGSLRRIGFFWKAALDGSLDRNALSWTRFSLNSTSPRAGEGWFHDFDLAQAIQNPGVGADLARGSSDVGGRQGRFSALAGCLVAECGRPAPWNGVVSRRRKGPTGPRRCDSRCCGEVEPRGASARVRPGPSRRASSRSCKDLAIDRARLRGGRSKRKWPPEGGHS
jgi:hypothetical protein